MKTADYNEISKVYDSVRDADLRLIDHLLESLPKREGICILDIGCGTGNYTNLVEWRTRKEGCRVFGLDPSPGMLINARQKNQCIEFKQGTAAEIPWDDDSFDFIYMTDVIHHVPDMSRMFTEMRRVLKPGGRACIVTQSHKQIETRPIVRFFPGTANIDKGRYPDIGEIIKTADRHSLNCERQEVFSKGENIMLGMEFLELVRLRGYSMLWILPDTEYAAGLRALEEALKVGPIQAQTAGDTLIWLSKA